MTPNQNNLKLNENGVENIITETKPESIKTECENTTNEKKWTRNCPKCGKELIYKEKRVLSQANKVNRFCFECAVKYTRKNKKYFRKCPRCNKKIGYTTKHSLKRNKFKLCKDCSHIGLKYNVVKPIYTKDQLIRNCPTCGRIVRYKNIHTKKKADKLNRICQHCVGNIAIKSRGPWNDASKEKLSKYRKGKTYKELGINVDLIARGRKISLLQTGKKYTDKRKQSMRVARAKFIQKYHGGPNFNPEACKYFDELSKQNGWNLRHALNGGEVFLNEIGYWVDAYDKEKNIVVEYNESYHYKNEKIIQHDYNRMKNIITYLQCKFWVYNEKINELKEYII